MTLLLTYLIVLHCRRPVLRESGLCRFKTAEGVLTCLRRTVTPHSAQVEK